MRFRGLLASAFLGVVATSLSAPAAAASGRNFVSEHTVTIEGEPVPYVAAVEEYKVKDQGGDEALSLFATSYVRSDVKDTKKRPVVFLFNGGPSAAALGLHTELGPRQPAEGSRERFKANSAEKIDFADNPDSLLDIADLVFFDPAETGFSRLLKEESRAYFYSTTGDPDSVVQLIHQWRKAHDREDSPLYILGESYGSIRQVVAGSQLRREGVKLDGQIIFGDSIFLMETSRRAHNIVSTAVSLPVLAMTAAYHGKADMRGMSLGGYLDEVYRFSMEEYLPALAMGWSLSESRRKKVASELERYTSIPQSYFLEHDLAIAKHIFNRTLIPGKALNANDTRVVEEATSKKEHGGDPTDAYRFEQAVLSSYMHDELGVKLDGVDYRIFAPDSFSSWEWGQGCSDYVAGAGLCSPDWGKRTPFVDYDWPEQLKAAFADPDFRAMIVSGIYDGLSSVGTHRYLQSQLGFPKDRFEIREYEAGHATAADPEARPLVKADLRTFLNGEMP